MAAHHRRPRQLDDSVLNLVTGIRLDRRDDAIGPLAPLAVFAVVRDEVVRIQHKYPGGNSVELRFFEVLEYSGELENRIFREIVWTDPKDLPTYDFLEADLTLVRDLAQGKLR